MAATTDAIHCYLLLKTTQGIKDVSAGLGSNDDDGYNHMLSMLGIQRTNVQVSRGEFMVLAPSQDGLDPNIQKYQLFRDPSIFITVPNTDMSPLTRKEYDFLASHEVNPDRRYELHVYLLENPIVPPKPKIEIKPKPTDFKPVVGMTVLVPSYGQQGNHYYGKVRWVGVFEGREDHMAGIELEESVEGCSDGVTKQGTRYFHCSPGRGLFYSYSALHPDTREGSEKPEPEEMDDSPLEATSPDTSSVTEQPDFSEPSIAKLTSPVNQESPKAKSIEEDTLPDEVESLREQVRTLTEQLAQEKRKRQTLEYELAMEKRKTLELKQGRVLSNTNSEEMTPLASPARAKALFDLGWRLDRSEVMRTRTLGGGAWGLVYEGWYRNQAVAIKEPHLAIMSVETNKRMEREINIIASVQHPNLVRFIGAVMDADSQSLKLPPLLVTELLDIDLRSAYSKHDLLPATVAILLDVAHALHYLHTRKDPIIHRDVSAPNVLLQALPQDMWRAKVTDFGSANVAKFSKTAAEGAIIYSAPETFPSINPMVPQAKQTTKIDVFSFGILVCEVVTCRLPTPESRQELIAEVRTKWILLYQLIKECVRELPEERQEMADIVKILHSIPPKKKL